MGKYQRGFTLIELVIAIGGVATLIAVIAVVCTVVHFIAKFW